MSITNQNSSSTPFSQHKNDNTWDLPDRKWPSCNIVNAPVWCSADLREASQHSVNPQSVSQKLKLFNLLISMGFKEIEVGIPAESRVDFDFLRMLIKNKLVPNDVLIQVYCPLDEDLIKRTFESLKDCRRFILHLHDSIDYNTKPAVLEANKEYVKQHVQNTATLVKQLSTEMVSSSVYLEYSPANFSLSETAFALELCEIISHIWQPTNTCKIILNLPTAFEASTPNRQADQIEWFIRNLKRREATIISLHLGNGNSASTDASLLKLLAGADRIEGSLFGSGKDTNSATIISIAMHFMAQGIDPKLEIPNLSAIDQTSSMREFLTLHRNHSFSKSVTFTALPCTHQNGIQKEVDLFNASELDKTDLSSPPTESYDAGTIYRKSSREEPIAGIPLTYGQEALWMLHKKRADSGIYNCILAWVLPTDINLTGLKQAINLAVLRHPVLRSLFRTNSNGKPIQQIQKKFESTICNVDIKNLSTDETLKRLISDLHKPFDFDLEAPIRWLIYEQSDNRFSLAIHFHHTIIDLWSSVSLLEDINKYYSIELGNELRKFETPLCSFEEFFNEQSALVNSKKGKQLLSFWRDQLEGMTQTLNLSTDYPRPAQQTFSKRRYQFEFDAETQEAFGEFSNKHDLSLFSQYLALFHLLLHKYSHQSDISIGTPTAGRDDRYKGLCGYFANPIIIRAQINRKDSLIDFLTKQADITKKALAASALPFPVIANDIITDRDPSRAPLIQVSFVWENINRFEHKEMPLVHRGKNGNEVWAFDTMGDWKRYPIVQQLDDFDITLKIHKIGNSIYGGFEYNANLFRESTIKRMAESYQTLMKSVVLNSDQSIATTSAVSEIDIRKLLNWNETQQTYNPQNNFLKVFNSVVSEHPNSIAVKSNHNQISYGELDRRSNKLAHFLVQQGLQSNQVVGIALSRNIQIPISLLAVFKAGCAYLPLDPEYPKDRLTHMLTDSGVKMVITDQKSLSSIPAKPEKLVCLDTHADEIQCYSESPFPLNMNERRLAYVIYTSGSTGKPKGVAIEQRSLTNLILSQREVFSLKPNDNVLLFASLNFDASIFTLVLSLQFGSTLHIPHKENILGDNLSKYINQHSISWVLLPPSLVNTLSPSQLPKLEHLVVGGEACTPELVKAWSKNRYLYNAYGPTEATVWSTVECQKNGSSASIGKPVANTKIYILDENRNLTPVGVTGELYIGGHGLARGYLHQTELTRERFERISINNQPAERLYRTGDLGRYLDDGKIEFLGRVDDQVKIRGYRIELGEIETLLQCHSSVQHAILVASNSRETLTKTTQLWAYVVPSISGNPQPSELRKFLRNTLPEYMIPSAFITLKDFPLTPSGKIDRKALPMPDFSHEQDVSRPTTRGNAIEEIISILWEQVLGIPNADTMSNFYDLGGNSLLLAQVHSKLPEKLKEKVSMVTLFKNPTISSLAKFIEDANNECELMVKPDSHMSRLQLRRDAIAEIGDVKIAIVGMAGRFPGAENVEQLWKSICDKRESITFFSRDELLARHEPLDIIDHPNYVPAKGLIGNISSFDADFFNFTPREAQITDPQQRVLLECAWETLEDAGCVPSKFDGSIGVYAGVGINNYMLSNLASNPELWHSVGDYPIMIGNDKDFLSARISYKLNLKGPAMVLQSACSSSLAAIHTASQALILGECDAALAGGVSFGRLNKTGYMYREGMIMSPDGHCRAFDAAAKGTVQGQGAGLVLLKRLDDAIRSNDQIYAIIKGSATNNDGSNKQGFTAPSIEGQAKAIMMALASANTKASEIGYIETHGTGTPIGDPIEIEALRQCFTAAPNGKMFCAIGSLKTNIGHLDAASGVAGLIKTANALKTKTLPPSLHFEKPNPKIDFDKSPFYVNTETKPWEMDGGSRNAGVSSFGIGGTNVHIVLTEHEEIGKKDTSRPSQIITLSAKSKIALESMTGRLLNHLKLHPDINFQDVCYTLNVGREEFEFRRCLICRNKTDAIFALENISSKKENLSHYKRQENKIAFLFSGQGSQYYGMGKHLYRDEDLFRHIVNDCRRIIGDKLIYIFEDLDDKDYEVYSNKIHQTNIAQPTLFVFEYALARLLMSWGVKPDIMMGHSIGEYVAACLAGVFTLEQALKLVTKRGQLIYDLEEGKMLSVMLSANKVRRYLNKTISLAAINGPSHCVLSGSCNAIYALQDKLKQDDVQHRILNTSHAFHSHMMDPILDRFKEYVKHAHPKTPHTQFVSCQTGKNITDEEASSPEYWANHLRKEVKFHDGLDFILKDRYSHNQQWTVLEVGPGNILSTHTKRHPALQKSDLVTATTPYPYGRISDADYLAKKIGELWQNGISIDWNMFHENRGRTRISLPTYPFTKASYWIPERVSIYAEPNPDFELFGNESRTEAEHVETGTQQDIIAPRNSIEHRIMASWKAILGIDQISVFDNYFDLGGDSLLAVNLIDKLMTEFGIHISTSMLIQHPSITELADVIESCLQNDTKIPDAQADNVISSPLIIIQRGESNRKPLFMVHPIGGEVFCYRDLAQQLGKDQPVYAFQSPSLLGNSEPFSSIPEMAKAYILEMKRIGAEPPYLLGGSSFGGLVAYEMAQQLLDIGNKVSLLVMIDSPVPGDMPTHITDSAAILQSLLKDQLELSLEKLRKLNDQAQIDYVLEEAKAANKTHVLPPHLGVPLFRTWIGHQNATYQYEPKTYKGDVIFFRHTEPTEHFPTQPHSAWMKLIKGNFEIHQVPGNHVSMNYPPCVQVLATKLKLAFCHS